MCGLVGAFAAGGKPAGAATVVERMRDRMAHRGPDGAGIWSAQDGRCTLGHRRLSIIDLSAAAAQPMGNVAGSVMVVYNGEIYNHAELRRELENTGKYSWRTDHSDTEVLLHAYEEWGLDCVHKFYGMFAVAIFDARDPARPLLHLIRDRAGIKPLYFTRTSNGEWLFASEIRALAAHPDVSLEMDATAFWHYLTFIVAPAPLTLFKGIFKLPAGHVVTVDHSGATRFRQYWDCLPDPAEIYPESQLGESEAAEMLIRLLRTSIRRRMVSDVPFGVLLSGGIDSSMNVALMSELMDRPVTTFSIGYREEEAANEFVFARRISARYKTDHHETLISHKEAADFLPLLVRLQDEPIADNVCIPLYFLAKLVRDCGTTVVQVGEGADENFLGYWWCEHYRRKEIDVFLPAAASRIPFWRRWLSGAAGASGMPAAAEDADIRRRAEAGQELFWGGAACWWGEMRGKLTPDLSPFRGEVRCPVDGLLPRGFGELDSHEVVRHYQDPLSRSFAPPSVLVKIPYLEMKLRLPEHLLMRVDKLTMAHSIEARVPFLDHDVIEFAARLPAAYKLRDGVGKWLLKRAASSYLDQDMIHRKKQGFGAPMETWFREPAFGRRCIAAFERSELKRMNFIDNEYFEGMLKRQVDGTAGGYSFHLWTVLNAVLWYESWIMGREDCF